MTDDEPDEVRGEGAGSRLRVLTRRTPVAIGWLAADTVRRSVSRRRRTWWSASAVASEITDPSAS